MGGFFRYTHDVKTLAVASAGMLALSGVTALAASGGPAHHPLAASDMLAEAAAPASQRGALLQLVPWKLHDGYQKPVVKPSPAAPLQAAPAVAVPLPTATPAPVQTQAPAPPPPPAPAPQPQGSAQGDAVQLLDADGWGGQFNCLASVINVESGWNVYATNPGSGAYGIPQALPGSKMAVAGADWQTSAYTQLNWMINYYIKPVYGTPCNAWAHEQADGWY